MPTVTFYRFSKRKNSTKRPINIGGVDVSVKLKQECSVRYPSFILAGYQNDWNYLKWGNNYYFVNNVTFMTNDLVQVDCSKDLLASHIADIRSTRAFIEYSSTYSDEYITDNRISMTHDIIVKTSGIGPNEAPIYVTDTEGCMILQVVGAHNANESTFGFSNAFATDLGTSLYLSRHVINDSSIQGQIRNFMDRPFDALIRAWYVPFDLTTLAYGQATDICLGKDEVTSNVQGYPLGYYLRFDPQSIPVADNYDYDIPRNYGDFRDFEPYSKLYIHLPYIGYTELDAEVFRNDTSIHVDMRYDPIGGSVIYDIKGNTTGFEEQFIYNCSVELPIAQTRKDYLQGVGNIVGSVASGVAASMTSVMGGIAGGAGIISSVANAFQTHTASKNGISGCPCATWEVLDSDPTLYASKLRTVFLEQRAFLTTQDPQSTSFIDTNGRVVNRVRDISYLSGYVKCANASVDMEGFEDEKDEINSYLNGGFFYE